MRVPVRLPLLAALLAASLAAGCEGSATDAASTPVEQLTPEQKLRAERLISVFENGTIEIAYGYAAELGDGRGITAGRAGFTSATGDLLEVVEAYARARPGNALAGFLPELRRLAGAESGETGGLGGLRAAWRAAAADPLFRAAQDEVVERVYYLPALRLAYRYNLHSALARAALYDAIIQHGEGRDPDGLPAMLGRTRAQAGGLPGAGRGEAAWLGEFLDVRRAVLSSATDPETREVWAESVGRVDVWREILDAGNLDLAGPIHVATDEWRATVP